MHERDIKIIGFYYGLFNISTHYMTSLIFKNNGENGVVQLSPEPVLVVMVKYTLTNIFFAISSKMLIRIN